MAVALTTVCVSYKAEAIRGIHSEADDYRIALFTSAAALDEDTEAYSASNEVSGQGYTAGGNLLTGFAVATGSGKAWLDFDDTSWNPATITARFALIYNATQAGNPAVAVMDFQEDVTATNGPFDITFPTADADSALIRLN